MRLSRRYLFHLLVMLSFSENESMQNFFFEKDGNCPGETSVDYYQPLFRIYNSETTPKPVPRTVVCTGFRRMRTSPVNNNCYDTCRKLTYKHSQILTLQTNLVHEPNYLEELNMASMSIQKIEPGAFANLPELRVLDLEMNQLKGIGKGTFNSLGNLISLNLSHNLIGEIEDESFHGSVSIEILDLSHNKISALPADLFLHLSLKSLNLSNNLLVELRFCNMESTLTALILNNNLLKDIPNCLFLSNIKDLSLNSNSITVIHTTDLPPLLETLVISNNDLQYIDEHSFQSLKHLNSIDLSMNPLDTFNPNWFEGLENLTTLRINGNNMGSLQIARNNTAFLQKGTFQHLSGLMKLDLSGNSIDIIQLVVLNGLVSLVMLNISHNKIEYLQTGVFNGMNRLQYLDLSFNNIESFQPHVFEPMLKLRFLDIRFNHIKTMNVQQFLLFCPSMEKLSIDGNNLSCTDLGLISSNIKLDERIVLESGKTLSSENINGISCHEYIDGGLTKLKNISADKSVSTEDRKGETELISAINQLKFSFIFCTFIVSLLIVAIKLFPRVEKKYFKANRNQRNHEVPILTA